MTPLDLLVQKVKLLSEISFLNDNVSEREVEEACVNYLKFLGYKVSKNTNNYNVNNLDELIDFFYTNQSYYHNDDLCRVVSNRQKDRAIFSNFITSRQAELGYSYKSGLQESAYIISALFINEAALDLTVPIWTWIFSSAKYKWLIDKAINIVNETKEIYNTQEVERLVEKDELSSEEYLGFDFDRLRRIHGD